MALDAKEWWAKRSNGQKLVDAARKNKKKRENKIKKKFRDMRNENNKIATLQEEVEKLNKEKSMLIAACALALSDTQSLLINIEVKPKVTNLKRTISMLKKALKLVGVK